ncbi:hypothetical protein AB1Y20_000424 [Prymnesium parvum]|uniref:Uncharacterized protein n=1 Tax=Prymnesium parvum TaxID=97485 RepID=A0AB34K892_PRYPA
MASLFDRVNQSSESNRQRREAAGDGRLSRVAAEATQRLAAYWETMTAPGAALDLAAAPRHAPNAQMDASLGRGVSLERLQNSTNHPRRLEGAGVRSAGQSPGGATDIPVEQEADEGTRGERTALLHRGGAHRLAASLPDRVFIVPIAWLSTIQRPQQHSSAPLTASCHAQAQAEQCMPAHLLTAQLESIIPSSNCSQPNMSRSSRPPNETRATSTATASSKAKEAASTKAKVAASSKPSEAGSSKPSEAASSNAASSKAKEASSSIAHAAAATPDQRWRGAAAHLWLKVDPPALWLRQRSLLQRAIEAIEAALSRQRRHTGNEWPCPNAQAKRDRKRPQKSTPSNLSSPRSDSVLSSAASHRLSQSDERSHAALQEASCARMAGQHAKAALAVQDALESARNRERQTARIGTPTTKLRAHSDRVERSAVRARESLRTERLKEQAAPVRSSPQTPQALPRTPSRAAQTSRRCGAVNAKGGHPEGAPALDNFDARSPDQVERCGEADKGGWSAINWFRSLWGSPEKSCNSNESNVEGSRQPLGAEFVTSSAAAKMRGAQELKASLAQQQAQHQSLLAPNQVAKILGRLDVEILPLVAQGFEIEQGESLNKAIARLSHSDARTLMLGLLSVPPNGPVDLNAAMSAARRVYEVGETQDCKKISRLCAQTTSSIYIGDADFAMMSTAAPLSDYVQQIVRVEQVRGSFQNEEETLGAKHAAAEVVQGAYRCFRKRTSRLREIAQVKRIGTIESGQQAQQAQDEEARKSRAVSVIQARARGKLTRDRTRTLRLITQHAAPMQARLQWILGRPMVSTCC